MMTRLLLALFVSFLLTVAFPLTLIEGRASWAAAYFHGPGWIAGLLVGTVAMFLLFGRRGAAAGAPNAQPGPDPAGTSEPGPPR